LIPTDIVHNNNVPLAHVARKTTPAAALAALGIVYGDLGTCPLYTLQAVVGATGGHFSPEAALGSLSLILVRRLPGRLPRGRERVSLGYRAPGAALQRENSPRLGRRHERIETMNNATTITAIAVAALLFVGPAAGQLPWHYL
jgi:hypothetical protein